MADDWNPLLNTDRDRNAEAARQNEVVVVDVKMSFWSMVTFMVKWAIAAIPAFLILAVLGAMLAGFIAGMGAGR